MKLDNLQFDDDVQTTPIIDKAEAKRLKQREYNARWKAKQKAKLQTTTKRALAIPATSLTKSPSAEQLVNTMSVGLAKAVYLELKKVFEA
jgi:hypothetical protein